MINKYLFNEQINQKMLTYVNFFKNGPFPKCENFRKIFERGHLKVNLQDSLQKEITPCREPGIASTHSIPKLSIRDQQQLSPKLLVY